MCLKTNSKTVIFIAFLIPLIPLRKKTKQISPTHVPVPFPLPGGKALYHRLPHVQHGCCTANSRHRMMVWAFFLAHPEMG